MGVAWQCVAAAGRPEPASTGPAWSGCSTAQHSRLHGARCLAHALVAAAVRQYHSKPPGDAQGNSHSAYKAGAALRDPRQLLFLGLPSLPLHEALAVRPAPP